MGIELKRPSSRGVHVLLVLGGLLLAYGFYGVSLVIVAFKHMTPNLPAYYFWITLLLQVLPLLISALAWLVFLLTFQTRSLWICGLSWLFVAISVPALKLLGY